MHYRNFSPSSTPPMRARLALAIAFACGAGVALAAETAPKAAGDDARTPAAADTAQARRDLDQMREQMREMSRKMADLSAKLGDVGPRAYAYRYIGNPDRALIGVVFSDADYDRTHGLRIDAVTPGGPAEKAGLRHGDVIVAIDGKAIAAANRDETPEALKDLKVGQNVKLDIVRDGKKSQVTVSAERREPYNFAFAFGDGEHSLERLAELKALKNLDGRELLPPDFDRHVEERVEHALHQAQTGERAAERAGEAARRAMERFSFSSPWWGLNLANLNADLGSYFGTDHGVLVLSADNDALKTLKSGDVLVTIDGSKVERPEDALRLLRERSGSELKVQVLRQHKPVTLSMKAPEFKSMFVPPPPPPAAPLPPEPPAVPAPPAAPAAHPTPAARPAPPAPPAPPPPPVGEDERQAI
jgi:S1-C subfamily serine protease